MSGFESGYYVKVYHEYKYRYIVGNNNISSHFFAYSGVLKRMRATLDCMSTLNTFPPQLSLSRSNRLKILCRETPAGRPLTSTVVARDCLDRGYCVWGGYVQHTYLCVTFHLFVRVSIS